MKKILTVFSPILVASLAIVLDRLYDTTAVQSHRVLALSLMQIAEIVLITALLIGLAWYVLYFVDHSLWVVLAYVIVGSLISVFTTLAGYYALSSIIDNHTLHQWYESIMTSRAALTRHTGAFVLLIGIMRLIPERFLWNKQ